MYFYGPRLSVLCTEHPECITIRITPRDLTIAGQVEEADAHTWASRTTARILGPLYDYIIFSIFVLYELEVACVYTCGLQTSPFRRPCLPREVPLACHRKIKYLRRGQLGVEVRRVLCNTGYSVRYKRQEWINPASPEPGGCVFDPSLLLSHYWWGLPLCPGAPSKTTLFHSRRKRISPSLGADSQKRWSMLRVLFYQNLKIYPEPMHSQPLTSPEMAEKLRVAKFSTLIVDTSCISVQPACNGAQHIWWKMTYPKMLESIWDIQVDDATSAAEVVVTTISKK